MQPPAFEAGDRVDPGSSSPGIDEEGARRIAVALVQRHARAARQPARLHDAATLERRLKAATSGLVREAPDLDTPGLRELEQQQLHFLALHADRFLARAGANRILAQAVALRLADVVLPAQGPARIEAEREGPPGDVCFELAGIALDLRIADLAGPAERLLSHYAGEAEDFEIYDVYDCLECLCALERARSAVRDDVAGHETARALASRLVALTLSGRRTPGPAVVVAMGGGVASGKSTLARVVAQGMAAPRVVADRVRDQLIRGVPGREQHEAHGWENLQPGFHERVYAETLRRAERVLQSGRAVVVDACFPRARDRAAVRALARRYGAPFRFVECRIDERTQRERLAAREAAAGERGWLELARSFAAAWEPASELPGEEHLVLDTARPPDESAAILARCLPEWRAPQPDHPSIHRLPRPPAAVTFDCWQTLMSEENWELAHARRVDALVRAAGEAGRAVSTAEAGSVFDEAWAHHMVCWQKGVATGAPEVALHALSLLGLSEPHPALEHLVREYQESSHTSRVVALAGARESLAALARAGVRRALVCDTGLTPGRIVRRHLERLGLMPYLEVCVFSDELGVPKPDSRTFRAALESLAVTPGDAVHVGDLRRTDVAGARGVGMGTIRIRARHDDRSDLPEADAVVDSHAELRALLGVGVQR